MLFEVEVEAAGNSPMNLNRVFDLLSEPKAITRLFTADLSGQDAWCEVTGWSQEGPCPAYAALSEDSGEGVVLLVYGGEQGIRLRPVGHPGDWDLRDGSQWGESCLMLDSEAAVE
jgi:hypothetical protein